MEIVAHRAHWGFSTRVAVRDPEYKDLWGSFEDFSSNFETRHNKKDAMAASSKASDGLANLVIEGFSRVMMGLLGHAVISAGWQTILLASSIRKLKATPGDLQ